MPALANQWRSARLALRPMILRTRAHGHPDAKVNSRHHHRHRHQPRPELHRRLRRSGRRHHHQCHQRGIAIRLALRPVSAPTPPAVTRKPLRRLAAPRPASGHGPRGCQDQPRRGGGARHAGRRRALGLGAVRRCHDVVALSPCRAVTRPPRRPRGQGSASSVESDSKSN